MIYNQNKKKEKHEIKWNKKLNTKRDSAQKDRKITLPRWPHHPVERPEHTL